MNSRAPDDVPGDSIGSYRIVSLLGEGGMGRVYLATDRDGHHVAIKLIRRALAHDSVFRKRFEREARIAREVVNPHVVPVIDVGEVDETPYLVQRFMSGGSLEDRLRRDGRLGVTVALRLAADVAIGLEALAAHGMVHRDVKPANVLLRDDGTAAITDFGLARDSKGTALTGLGQTLGSPHYMAPEQIRGQDVTAATDVYSLGCVLCECLSGEPPFAGKRGMQVLWAQMTEAPPDPVPDSPSVPVELGPAVLKALAKDPSERPTSAVQYVRLVYAAAGIEPPDGDCDG